MDLCWGQLYWSVLKQAWSQTRVSNWPCVCVVVSLPVVPVSFQPGRPQPGWRDELVTDSSVALTVLVMLGCLHFQTDPPHNPAWSSRMCTCRCSVTSARIVLSSLWRIHLFCVWLWVINVTQTGLDPDWWLISLWFLFICSMKGLKSTQIAALH